MLRRLAVLAAIGLIAGTLLIAGGGHDPAPVAMREPVAQQPGYSARDAEIIETGPDGRPRYRLRATSIVQQPVDASILLRDISMIYRVEGGTDWRLTAERGWMPQDARTIELEGNVLVSELPLGSGESARIATERLSFDTQTERIATSRPVALDWSGHKLVARGLVADLNDQLVSLESDVHGRFLP